MAIGCSTTLGNCADICDGDQHNVKLKNSLIFESQSQTVLSFTNVKRCLIDNYFALLTGLTFEFAELSFIWLHTFALIGAIGFFGDTLRIVLTFVLVTRI